MLSLIEKMILDVLVGSGNALKAAGFSSFADMWKSSSSTADYASKLFHWAQSVFADEKQYPFDGPVPSSIVSTEFPILTDFNELQPLNAPAPIKSTESSMVIDVNDSQ